MAMIERKELHEEIKGLEAQLRKANEEKAEAERTALRIEGAIRLAQHLADRSVKKDVEARQAEKEAAEKAA
jgi:hypothetical protein